MIIHDQRRLLLRDPELPDVMLPAEWPGQKARLLCKELYRRLAPASERHPDRCLVLADGTIPPADPAFADRFPQDDPLAAMSLQAQAGREFCGSERRSGRPKRVILAMRCT